MRKIQIPQIMKTSATAFLCVLGLFAVQAAEDGNLRLGNNQERGEEEGNLHLPHRLLTVDEARAEDINLIAETSGWTRDQVEKHMDLQDAFSDLISNLKDDDNFAGSEMPDIPGGSPKVLFKNGIPQGLEDKVKGFEQANKITVNRIATKFSIKEQQDRGKKFQDKLEKKQFENVGFAVRGEKLFLIANKPKGNNKIKPTPPGRLIAEDKIDEVAAKVLDLQPNDDDLHGLQLDIFDDDQEISTPTQTRGGRKIYNSVTGGQCTGAFTVRQSLPSYPYFNYGLLTAGHCMGMNTYDAEDPGEDYSIALKEAWFNNYGDWGWYTTAGQEYPHYWASPTSWRYVTGWDVVPSVNEWVCVYSRMKATRVCKKIYAYPVSVRYWGIFPVDNMVATDTTTIIGGDSGGPWSWSTTAYGVTSGTSTIAGIRRDIYSPMINMKASLGYDMDLLTV